MDGFLFFPYKAMIDKPVLVSTPSLISSPASAFPLNPCSGAKTYSRAGGVYLLRAIVHGHFIVLPCHWEAECIHSYMPPRPVEKNELTFICSHGPGELDV